jgi:predicted RNA-binding protein (virulence factor B family)
MELNIGQVVILEVTAVEPIGAFLKIGADKDLFLPNSEKRGELLPGDKVVVQIRKDDSDRFFATEKFEKELLKCAEKFELNQQVDLIIFARTDLGYKAVINQKAVGVLYHNEVFEKLYYSQNLKGYIRKIREDGKIDLILRAAGHKATEDIGLKIIEFLEDQGGFYALTDKTPPEKIYELFGVSKKKYKIALGGLYKMRVVEVTDDGVKLLK